MVGARWHRVGLTVGLTGALALATFSRPAHAQAPAAERGGSRLLHIFNVHLVLRYVERIRQVRMLAGIADPRALEGPRLLLGDFNEWFNGQASRLLRAEFGHPCGRRRSVRTHPSVLPVFPLDRIYHDPALSVDRVVVHRSGVARIASDHLPTYADLKVRLSG